ncbi:hypothetical protein E4T39_00043 [Aureobasidium subglaciale]|nr:hypothetical protein E4T39_00043 [Aureobasidium subglaciale]
MPGSAPSVSLRAPPNDMDIPYQALYQPVDETQNMQSLFVEQPQYYGFPPPTGSSLDSGYAGEDINPFEDNVFDPDLKIAFGQQINSTAPDFGTYGYTANNQLTSGPDPTYMPVAFNAPFTHNYSSLKQSGNISQSPPALVADDSISVKSEDASSVAASPQTTTFPNCQQSRKRPSMLKRAATDTSLENPPASIQRQPAKEGRGRTRKRIPHTAVERRYRENLNTQLENLRCALPKLQAAHRRRPSDPNDPMKPSKCEILIGAVEHIKRLEEQVKGLKKRLGE